MTNLLQTALRLRRIGDVSQVRSHPVTSRAVTEMTKTAAPRFFSYTTLCELRGLLNSLDAVGDLVVVLILDPFFCGHLPSLIERRSKQTPARLVLVIESGRLPGLDLDSADPAATLGWQTIEAATDPVAAVREQATLCSGEAVVVFAPSWSVKNVGFRSLARSDPFSTPS